MVHRVVYTRLYDSEVEYLESTGTQYLNLGHIPWDKEILFETQTAYTRKYGVGREGSSDAFYMGYNENRYETAWMTYYGTLDDNYHIISKKLNYEDNPQRLFSYIDGVEVFRYDMDIDKNTAYKYDLLVFAICGIDGPGFYMCCKKKSFKVIVDGVIVHDLIPVRKGNIGYMYDKVSGKLFGNQGTGNFILGQDVANPVPKIRNVIYYSPYDAEVEYLESTGTQWIDTFIHPLTNYGFELYGGLTGFTNQEFFGGGISYRNGLGVITHNAGGRSYGVVVGTTEVCTIPCIVNDMHLFKVNTDGTVYVDNEYKGESTTAIPDGSYTMNIFRHSGTRAPIAARIYYCKIYSTEGIIFDAIPVRIGSVGYMYDKVSKRLFENKGTGNFILGNDVANPVPKIRSVVYFSHYDAKVEYLRSPASASTYIDTGLKQSDIVSIETQFADISGYGVTYRYSIGSGTGSNDSNILGFKNYNGNLTVNLKGSTTTVLSGHLNTFKTVSVNFVTGAVKINSAERELTPCELTDDILYLFKIPTVSGQPYGFQPIMLKYFKAFSANNTLIRDMIPVRVGQIGYMYDKVSGKLFGNSGTGNFILGNDIN